MTARLCSIESCDGKHMARGWCYKHYKRWWSTGSVEREPAPTECKIEGCPKPVHALGWCSGHHRRWHKTGDPLPTAASRCVPGDALPGERWLPAVGFPGYEVSDLGRVRRLMGHGATRLLLGRVVPDGYVQVALTVAGRRRQVQVHRLVLTAFVGPCPEGQECCHGNGVPADNRLANLRWDTRPANWADRKRHRRGMTGVMASGL